MRAHALRTLGLIGASDPESIELMIAAVREGGDDERLYATAGLGLLGPDASDAVDAICGALRDPEILNANAAAVALIRIGERTESVGDALAQALKDENDANRYHDLLHAVGLLHAPSLEAAICIDTALESNHADLRACGVVAGYLASDDPSILGDALLDAGEYSPVISVLSDWDIDVEPFAEEILHLLSQRSKLEHAPGIGDGDPQALLDSSVDSGPHLFKLAGQLGERSREAIPLLDCIATSEHEQESTRAQATDWLATLRARFG